jgi:hypothetical protein
MGFLSSLRYITHGFSVRYITHRFSVLYFPWVLQICKRSFISLIYCIDQKGAVHCVREDEIFVVQDVIGEGLVYIRLLGWPYNVCTLSDVDAYN